MKSLLSCTLLFFSMVTAGLFSASSIFAQAQPSEPTSPGSDVFFYQKIGPGPILAGEGIGLVRFEGSMEQKVVTGAPFSATVTQEFSQTLADGNRIVRNATGSFARDSQGRTRRDMALPTIGPWAASGKEAAHGILINDPVSGTRYVLDPARKIAHEAPSHSAAEAHPKSAAKPDRTVEIQQESTTVSLGTQTINGVTAQGTRTIRTIPAGEIGNSKPITITVERWYSPDLQTFVLVKHSDPMMGDSVFQLTNIQRSEPDSSLFQVPSDYTVKQGRGSEVHVAPPPPDASPDAQ
jgi:hypothetical protein